MTIRPVFTSLLVIAVTICWHTGSSMLGGILRVETANSADAAEILSIVAIVASASLWFGGLLALWLGPRVLLFAGSLVFLVAALVPNGPLLGAPRPLLLMSIASGLLIPGLYAVAGTLVLSTRGRRALRTSLFMLLVALATLTTRLSERTVELIRSVGDGQQGFEILQVVATGAAIGCAACATLIMFSGRKLQPLKHDLSMPRRFTGIFVLAVFVGGFQFARVVLDNVAISLDRAADVLGLASIPAQVEYRLLPLAIALVCMLLAIAFLFTGSYGRRMCMHRVIGLGFAVATAGLIGYRMLMDPATQAADPNSPLRISSVILIGAAYALIHVPALAMASSGLPERVQSLGIVLFLSIESFLGGFGARFGSFGDAESVASAGTTVALLAGGCLIAALLLGFFGRWLERRLRSGALMKTEKSSIARHDRPQVKVRRDLHP